MKRYKLKDIPLIGAVIIGRNEGERLRQCLLSVVNRSNHVVYADSGSTDGSVDLAHEFGITVVVLNSSIPFTAARGRNAGFSRLMLEAPDTEFVQFIDGDCELKDGWFEAAIEFLHEHAQHAVVCGRLRERYPKASFYNSLCDIEWNGPVGDIDACGGIFMIRTKVFVEIGGMDSTIAAGEEPEMCLRLRHYGWLVSRIKNEMAWHDANISSFGQWWKRAVRSGYGAVDVYARTGGQVFAVQLRRTRLWTIGWIITLFCVFAAEPLFEKNMFLLFVLAVIAVYPLQILRIAARMPRKGLSFREALGYGGLMMISKWAELYGHFSRYVSFGRSKSK